MPACDQESLPCLCWVHHFFFRLNICHFCFWPLMISMTNRSLLKSWLMDTWCHPFWLCHHFSLRNPNRLRGRSVAATTSCCAVICWTSSKERTFSTWWWPRTSLWLGLRGQLELYQDLPGQGAEIEHRLNIGIFIKTWLICGQKTSPTYTERGRVDRKQCSEWWSIGFMCLWNPKFGTM